MTIRPFHLIDGRGRDAARLVAIYFSFVATLGVLPALYGLFYLGLFGVLGLAGGDLVMAGACLFTGSFIAFGLRLGYFYYRRILEPVADSKKRWAQTVLYNAVIMLAALAWAISEPSWLAIPAVVGSFVTVGLAVVALEHDEDPS